MSLLRLQYYCVLGAVAGAVLFATLRYMPAAGSGAALSTTSALATAAAPAGAGSGAGEHRKIKGTAPAPAKAAAKVVTKPKEVVVFNFGDSNSDTGGVAAIMGIRIAAPEGRAFFHHPTGRLSDGRVVLDFISALGIDCGEGEGAFELKITSSNKVGGRIENHG
uniref:GDSL esterase/lipase n=1 Tax=Aegilops tauschii TaxID=37682 RepID=M8CKT8_AEGTA